MSEKEDNLDPILETAAISSLIRAIYNGKYNSLKLPKNLYSAISNSLIKGVDKGFGIDIEYNSPDLLMLKELRENTYIFSAAKTFNYVLSTENLIVEGNEVLPFKEFKKRALMVYQEYNETWLQAEYNTAIGQAQSARAWGRYPDDSILRYVTANDANVSIICKSLHDVTRPKNDPFWVAHSPLNHYDCRCHLDSSFENKTKPIPDTVISPSKEFAFNPGIEKQVFDKSHPYFNVPERYKKFAKRNFDLPLPESE